MESDCQVRVIPKEGLFFPPPLNRPIINHITLINENDKPLTFKIKTTSPNSYVVKPRMGILPPRGGEAKVRILLRAVTKDEDENARTHDKFQIECRFVSAVEMPEGVNTNAETLWQDKSLTSRKQLIPCAFTSNVPANIRLQISSDLSEGSPSESSSTAPTAAPSAKQPSAATGGHGGTAPASGNTDSGNAATPTASRQQVQQPPQQQQSGQVEILQRELGLVTHERQQLQREITTLNDRLTQKDGELRQSKTRETDLQKELSRAQAQARQNRRGWISSFIHSPLWFLLTLLLAWVLWSSYIS